MEKKTIIILIIILALVAVGAFWFLGGQNSITSLWNKYISQRKSAEQNLIPLSPTDDEKKIVENKTEEEIRNDFEGKKALCLEDFKNEQIQEAMFKYSLEKERAETYFECQAIAKENLGECEIFGNDSAEYKKCRQNFLLSVKFAFPAMKQKECNEAMVSACQEAGVNDCKAICQTIISQFNSDCSAISSISQRAACEALGKGNLEPCDLLSQEKEKQFCKFAYYLTSAARSNSAEILKNIATKESYFLAKLYFDKESTCKELAAYMGELQCGRIYTDNYLNRLIEIGRDLRGDYKSKPKNQ